jgi:hypothetical protein
MMLVYGALNNNSAIELEVDDPGCGAGRIKCLECGGTR